MDETPYFDCCRVYAFNTRAVVYGPCSEAYQHAEGVPTDDELRQFASECRAAGVPPEEINERATRCIAMYQEQQALFGAVFAKYDEWIAWIYGSRPADRSTLS